MARPLLACAAVVLCVTVLAAQLKVDVQLITVTATVTDGKGRYVSHLTADDFVIEEDGRAQTISHFEQSLDLPVSMGIVLDTSGSMERKIGGAAEAVARFIRSVHEDDDIFLMTFSGRSQLRQDFTDDRNKLTSALRRLRVGGDTALYDALEDGLKKIKSGKHKKKAILLITDGEDTSSEITFDDAKERIRESELLVYCLGISPAPLANMGETPPVRVPRRGRNPFPLPVPGGPGGPHPRSPQDSVDMRVLNAFADASGGKAWLISGDWTDRGGNQIEQALDEIAAELRNQYSIGYYPAQGRKDGKYHRVNLKTKDSRYQVRARKEYFAG